MGSPTMSDTCNHEKDVYQDVHDFDMEPSAKPSLEMAVKIPETTTIVPTKANDEEEEEEEDPPKVDPKGTDVFSVFTVKQKRLIILTASLAGLFSPLSGSIYYPALNTIASDLNVSASKVNLTVTTYMIIQGLAPMITAGFSDGAGRRPAYIICFVIYLIADLGLALQNNYAALLVLRMLQSGGSSGTIALANGVVGDMITSAERGSYIAFASVSSVLGPTLSPILGGLISQYWNWHGIFWFLLAFGGVFFIPLLLFLPETCRKVVGNGSLYPPPLNRNLTDYIRQKHRLASSSSPTTTSSPTPKAHNKLTLPNPLKTLTVLTDPASAIVLLAAGLAMADFYAISTGASTALGTIYSFDDLRVSLCFLPIGCGGILSAFTTGKLVDWNYRRHATRLCIPVDKLRQRDLSDFPIEKARLEIALPLFYLGSLAVVGYGWALEARVSLAGPIVLLFLMGYGVTAAFQVLNVLMVDLHPGKAATATAANNIVRCELGAAASAAIVPMTAAMGYGWAYTVVALLFLVFSPLLWLLMGRGMDWRRVKREKEEARRVREEEMEEKRRKEVEDGVEDLVQQRVADGVSAGEKV